jgi:outer membrane protein OmpA-like peptidoglycan-associated protein
MKNFFIALIVFAVWTFFALWLYSFIKSSQISDIPLEEVLNKQQEQVTIAKADSSLSNAKQLTTAVADTIATEQKPNIPENSLYGKTKQGDVVFYFDEGLKFKKNDSIVHTTSQNIDYPYKVLNYLVQHPNKEVMIVSTYSANEGINSPNYGVVRGEFVKEALVDVGIKRSHIIVRSEIKEIQFDQNGFYSNGIRFVFDALNLERVAALKDELPENRILYPGFNGAGIVANKELEALASQLKELFIKRPETTVKIIGHTDNIGNFQDNYATGLKYARQVRWYLISKADLNRNLITAVSKGEAEPIDSNNSDRGRNKNRRIEVIFN